VCHSLVYSETTNLVKKKRLRIAAFGSFVYKVFPTPDRCFLGSKSNSAVISSTANGVTSEAHCAEVKCICVCIYEFCLINGHRLPCCRLYYLPLSKPWQAHQKKTCNMITNINSVITITSHVLHFCITYPLLVDLAGVEPASRSPSL